MRRVVHALVLAVALTVSLGMLASPAARADGDPDLTPHVDPSLLSERHMREPEILHEKPSGFWTSNRPAVGGAYRYRLLLLGVGIAAIMGTIIIVAIRRGSRERARALTAGSTERARRPA